MQDPLKQGLKPTCWVKFRIISFIRMQDPLKQGLKLRILIGTAQPLLFECKIH